jgi:hypothetical protein
MPETESPEAAQVTLTVEGPEVVLVGAELLLKLTVRNTSEREAEDVVIECTLGEGLSVPGATERAFRRRLGELGIREVRTVELSLRTTNPGTSTVEFRVLSGGRVQVVRTVRTECRQGTVELELSGPDERIVGQRAEFVITVTNVSPRDQSDVRVALAFDGALQPQEASTGAVQTSGRLAWDLGLLRLGERVQIQAEFACPSMSHQGCLSVDLTGRDLERQQVESCLRVLPHAATVIEIHDAEDPLTVGDEARFQVHVSNRGLERLRDVELVIAAERFDPDSIVVVPAAGGAPVPRQRGPSSLMVRLPGELPPDRTMTLAVSARASEVGEGRLTVAVAGPQAGSSHKTTETTVINPVTDPALLTLPTLPEELVRGR